MLVDSAKLLRCYTASNYVDLLCSMYFQGVFEVFIGKRMYLTTGECLFGGGEDQTILCLLIGWLRTGYFIYMDLFFVFLKMF